MRDYEITVLVNPNLEDKKIDGWVKSFESLLNKSSAKLKGKKLEVVKKPLVYGIKKNKEAYYLFTQAQIEPEKLSELEKGLKTDENVMRYLVIKK